MTQVSLLGGWLGTGDKKKKKTKTLIPHFNIER